MVDSWQARVLAEPAIRSQTSYLLELQISLAGTEISGGTDLEKPYKIKCPNQTCLRVISESWAHAEDAEW